MKPNINNYEFIEPGSGTMPEDDNSGAPPAAMPSPKPKKAGIVTKEELAKSGYDNLRDYLNAKQGLTRRKEPKSSSPKLIDPSNIRSGPRFDDEGLIDPSNIRSGRREFEESQLAPKDKTKMSVTERLKSKFGMKSGGMVSSASKRADGIAIKGKTRGKMC